MGGTEAYLEGSVARRIQFFCDTPGPRAVFNALARLMDGYRFERERAEQDLAVAEGQLRDYESRLGTPFRHDEYQRKLTELRDGLKLGLSDKAPEAGAEGPTAPELAEAIQALRAEQVAAAAPTRANPPPKPVNPRRRAETVEVPSEEPLTPPPPVDEDDDSTPPSFRQQVRSRPVQRSLF
jgi:hypothetical protein